MAVRKDSALQRLLVALEVDFEGDDAKLLSVDDVDITNGSLSVFYTYSSSLYENKAEEHNDSTSWELFEASDETYNCGSREIGNFSIPLDSVVPQVVEAMKDYLRASKLGLVVATTYDQPGADKLLKASGFDGKPFYNPGTRHTCTVWTWRRAGGR